MTTDQAKAQAKKRWGNKFYLRNMGHMSGPERRAKAKDAFLAAKSEIEAIDNEIKQRLAECDWYQELTTRKRKLQKVKDTNQGESHYYRFGVGKTGSMFTEILGHGDTWEEAFAKADERTNANVA
jgi:hypothetical protein